MIPNPPPLPFQPRINPPAVYLRYWFGGGPPGTTTQFASYARAMTLYSGAVSPGRGPGIPLVAPLARFGMRYGAVAITTSGRWFPQREWDLPP